MLALCISVLILVLAPVVAKVLRARPMMRSGFDAFTLVAVLALIALTLLPEALAHGGVWSLIFAALGFALPSLAERLLHRAEAPTHKAALGVAAAALVVHATSDGTILALAQNDVQGWAVAAGVLLHRIGAAVTIWWVIRPAFSRRAGYTVLTAMAATTLIGFFLIPTGLDLLDTAAMGFWQAFAAGSLLHVILHPLEHTHTANSQQRLWAERLGTAAGLGFALAVLLSHLLLHGPLPFWADSISMPHQHHSLDLLMVAGSWLTPALVALHGAYGLWRMVRGDQILAALIAASPWLLLGWSAASLVLIGSAGAYLAVPPLWLAIAHIVWLGMIAAVAVTLGVRTFLAAILPASHHHHHPST